MGFIRLIFQKRCSTIFLLHHVRRVLLLFNYLQNKTKMDSERIHLAKFVYAYVPYKILHFIFLL